jgi:menaquinone-dependent protoporphyrinogen oxidase
MGNNMKILITYATRTGSTGEVAEAIGKELFKAGAEVDVRRIDNVKDMSPYQAVVIGSAVRAGQWLRDARDFVEENKEQLSKLRVAYFSICLTLRDDTPENRAKAVGYSESVRQIVKPTDEAHFAGKMDYHKLGFFARFIIRKIGKVPKGDFRDWELIQQWARELLPKLSVG